MSVWNPFHNPELPVEVFLSLYKVNHSLVKRLEDHLAPFELTLGRLCLLVSLRRFAKPVLPSELSDDLAVTRANISGLLNGLEKSTLIRRDFDPTNRRRILVQLTEEGNNLLDRVWPIYVESLSHRINEKLSSEEQRQLILLLRKLE